MSKFLWPLIGARLQCLFAPPIGGLSTANNCTLYSANSPFRCFTLSFIFTHKQISTPQTPQTPLMMIIDVLTNLISQSASMAGLQLLESGSPLSATWPRNHLDWLILFFSIVVSIFISQYSTVSGHALLETCLPRLSNRPSLKEYWNTQGKGGDETKSKLVAIRQHLDMFTQKVAATVSIFVSPTKSMVEMFAQAVSKHITRSRSEWPKVIKAVCNLATWWAFLYLPTSVAAYELKSEDDVTGYGPILVGAALVGAALFMFILLVLKVRHSVRGHMNSLVNGGRRLLENLSFGVLVTGLLVATVILLVLAFPHIYEFKGDVCVSEL